MLKANSYHIVILYVNSPVLLVRMTMNPQFVMAEKLKEMFVSRGYRLFLDSPTNQQFIILENKEISAVMVGMKRKEHVRENMEAIRRVE